MTQFQLRNQAVTLHSYKEEEEDNVKWEFELIDPVTRKVVQPIDWWPYGTMTDSDVQLYIKLGCPTREDGKTNGPLDREILERIAAERDQN